MNITIFFLLIHCICFIIQKYREIDGDAEKRRAIFYNCSLGSITRNYATKTENTEPVTETIPVTVNGDNVTGATLATFKPSDPGYETLFTEPAAPAFATGG